jgi:hypothetical protein
VKITNTDSHHAATIFSGTGPDIKLVGTIPPLCSREYPDGPFYWADTTRVSFDELDAAVAEAWERGEPKWKISAAARLIRKALEAV